MTLDGIREMFDLPEGCPIPGAIYRRKLSDGRWEFSTITGLEVLPRGRWTAIFSSVRFGAQQITSEVNRMEQFELHSIPTLASAETLESPKSVSTNGANIDELDLLLAAGA